MTDLLTTLTPALADRYAIEREIGRGGMATVYLARDLRHERKVAIKVLDPQLGAVLGVERFLSEIRVTANLQHPNLLPLFDSGAAEGLLYYVMPFVAGESLRHRLEREKQLPVDEAVRIAIGVARALAYAHAHGVIHRDLKPENILLQSGEPVVADFGIALAVRNAGGQRVTQTGMSLGTPQYMSPEQATGDRELDARSDLYSLGAVVYEMLTGEPPHTGNTVQAVIARLLTETPRPVRQIRPGVPPQVEAAVARALEKLPADRFASAERMIDALEGRDAGATQARAAWGSRSARVAGVPRALRLALLALPWLLAAGALVALLARGKPDEGVLVARAVIPLFDETLGSRVVITPDARHIVYVASVEGRRRIHVRPLDRLESQVLEGTDDALMPFVSPDSRWIAFFVRDRMKRVPLAGGRVEELATVASNPFRTGTWTTRNEIIAYDEGRLKRYPASGGEGVQLAPDSAKGVRRCSEPLGSPDGAYVFCNAGGPAGIEDDFLQVISLRTGEGFVTEIPIREPVAVIEGHLLFRRGDRALVAVRWNARSGRVEGTPFVVLEANNSVSVAGSGTVVYGVDEGIRRVVLRGGDSTRVLWTPPWPVISPRLSPDGRTLLVTRTDAGGVREAWTYDMATRTPTRLAAEGTRAEWTPDGRRVVYVASPATTSMRQSRELRWRAADMSEPERTLFRSDSLGVATVQVAPDGKSLLVGSGGAGPALWKVAVDSSVGPVRLVDPEGSPRAARLSPDGRWVAYVSVESGQPEVYVRPFAGAGATITISSGGGTEPVWDRQSRALYYRQGDAFVRAELTAGPPLRVNDRTVVLRGEFQQGSPESAYDAALDGQRLLVLETASGSARIVLVMHWLEELRRRIAEAAPE